MRSTRNLQTYTWVVVVADEQQGSDGRLESRAWSPDTASDSHCKFDRKISLLLIVTTSVPGCLSPGHHPPPGAHPLGPTRRHPSTTPPPQLYLSVSGNWSHSFCRRFVAPRPISTWIDTSPEVPYRCHRVAEDTFNDIIRDGSHRTEGCWDRDASEGHRMLVCFGVECFIWQDYFSTRATSDSLMLLSLLSKHLTYASCLMLRHRPESVGFQRRAYVSSALALSHRTISREKVLFPVAPKFVPIGKGLPDLRLIINDQPPAISVTFKPLIFRLCRSWGCSKTKLNTRRRTCLVGELGALLALSSPGTLACGGPNHTAVRAARCCARSRKTAVAPLVDRLGSLHWNWCLLTPLLFRRRTPTSGALKPGLLDMVTDIVAVSSRAALLEQVVASQCRDRQTAPGTCQGTLLHSCGGTVSYSRYCTVQRNWHVDCMSIAALNILDYVIRCGKSSSNNELTAGENGELARLRTIPDSIIQSESSEAS
ncbi:uncharacterized protein BXZ73DRAFT_79537 [Epithele typhae]|uniref:uncharacterized protein n=1 Tax=Epithele typhae TaxID=378194 RepID=UPI0020086C16|nr:uncharacterized protein BXZ73DRAFT_79537 [Epithele typhae]KAH9923479.1 hypothetical protein BXZ73DRAFT_79537 [Epithele typhae]